MKVVHLLALLAIASCTMTPQRAAAPDVRRLSAEQVRLASYVFPDDTTVATRCAGERAERDFLACLLSIRFASDHDSRALALRLYDETGVIAGVDVDRDMDDGSYRGVVHVEPALPVGSDRAHLEVVLEALRTLNVVLGEIRRRVPEVRFLQAPTALRFFRTVDRTTPSAYAWEGVIGYNLRGELWTTAESIEDTLIHELFHLSDAADHWSETELVEIYDHIREKCGTDAVCLEPFAPYDTRVDGGVYYAFHPRSDVREYGGELAIRFVRDQRDWMFGAKPVAAPFKCRRPENAAAWKAMADKFFGGLDLVPACG